MGTIAERMPLVADQAGVWDGEYVHLDATHNIIDRHKSRLVCRLFDDDPKEARLTQSNIYTWADGTREIRYFAGIFRGDRIWINNDLIDGWTGSIELDLTKRSIMVGWVRKDAVDMQFYELITVSPDGSAKNRAWHWYRNGSLFQRTLINEVRTSRDWRAYDDASLLTSKPRG